MKLEKRGSKDGFVHYACLQEYIGANTVVTALSLEKLDYLFRIYLTLVTAILLANLVHYYIEPIKHQIRIWLQIKQKLTAFIRTCNGHFSKQILQIKKIF